MTRWPPTPSRVRDVLPWLRRHRHGVSDVVLVGVWYLPVVLFTVLPGALRDDEPSASPSLIIRILRPSTAADIADRLEAGAILADPLSVLIAAIVFVVVPGFTAWGILQRRTRPQRFLVIAAVLLFLLGNIVPMALALYNYAAWRWNRRRLAGWSAVAVGALVVGYWGASVAVVLAPVGIALPLTLGLWIGTRRQLVTSLRERAVHLEREQHLMAERAVNAERTRIAREMHDVVAHRVSLMVVQAGGLEVSSADPATSDAANRIREAGRNALGELREVLGVLRDDAEAPIAPQPTVADVSRLLDGWSGAGTPIVLERRGSVRALPAQLERAAYRVVQEALTNAAKHAAGAPVRVELRYEVTEFVVKVCNGAPNRHLDRPTPVELNGTPAPRIPASGYGLAGLRERVQLVKGELSAGPIADGSWQVRAVFPVAPEGPEKHRPAPSGPGMGEQIMNDLPEECP